MKIDVNDNCEINTRDQIILAAARLFANRGYDGTSVRDIVQEAGVTKPVLYYYFKNKEDLYLSVIKGAYDYFFTYLTPLVQEDCPFLEKLEKVTKLYFTLTIEDVDMVRVIYDALFFPKRNRPSADVIWEKEEQHINLLKEIFQEGINKNIVRDDDLETLVHHYIGAVNIYLLLILTEQKALPAQAEKKVIDFVLHGIGKGSS